MIKKRIMNKGKPSNLCEKNLLTDIFVEFLWIRKGAVQTSPVSVRINTPFHVVNTPPARHCCLLQSTRSLPIQTRARSRTRRKKENASKVDLRQNRNPSAHHHCATRGVPFKNERKSSAFSQSVHSEGLERRRYFPSLCTATERPAQRITFISSDRSDDPLRIVQRQRNKFYFFCKDLTASGMLFSKIKTVFLPGD
ncbi:hypothetical protein AVEN_104119-1 [Araneus ventricosus]|uniref:Uncharacterized protein n=1 Tax=Araneus ventricosus TaxID=182803 RepID=A0A4Y2JAZ5_ARAVE|nr:hypothetical protein AVEN_104119-1 [Araneus ventricosus]